MSLNHIVLRAYVEEQEIRLDAKQLALRIFVLNANDPDDQGFQEVCQNWQDEIDAERTQLKLFKFEMARRN